MTRFAELLHLPMYALFPLLLDLVFLPVQIGVYLIWIGRRLDQHNKDLRQNYSNFGTKRLVWLRVFSVSLWVYLFIYSLMTLQNTSQSGAIFAAASLIFIWAFVLHGLGQSGFEPMMQNIDQKYRTSPLTSEQLRKIAAKIDKAMAQDHLFLDPDFSLDSLSKHLSIKPSYVSQALNSSLEKSFYEYVTSYRIEYCKSQLTNSDDTVLEIAFASGFNTRSAFY